MSSKLKVSDMLARAFAAEGVDHLFTLMGDANMYWSTAMAELPGMKVVHARHEHCCVAMADAYARATDKVGVGSVTCGPGYAQIMTALVMAARGNAPVVVFAGDAPIGASWYIQSIDQAPLALQWNIRCVTLFDQFPSPLTATGPAAFARLARQLSMPALQAAWQQLTGQPVPQAVRDYLTSHPDDNDELAEAA